MSDRYRYIWSHMVCINGRMRKQIKDVLETSRKESRAKIEARAIRLDHRDAGYYKNTEMIVEVVGAPDPSEWT